MFEIDTEMVLDESEDLSTDKPVDVRIEVSHIFVKKPDPTSWDSDMDYYGYREAEYKAYRMDTGEEIELDEDTFWKLAEQHLSEDP